MVSAATPLVVQAVYSEALTLFPDMRVSLGYLDDNDTARQVFAIGVTDIYGQGTANGSSADQQAGPMGTNRPRDENGTVTCFAGIHRGDMDQMQALQDVYSLIIEPIGSWIRSTPKLGITSLSLLVAEIRNERLELDSSTEGAVALVYFDIAFRARI